MNVCWNSFCLGASVAALMMVSRWPAMPNWDQKFVGALVLLGLSAYSLWMERER